MTTILMRVMFDMRSCTESTYGLMPSVRHHGGNGENACFASTNTVIMLFERLSWTPKKSKQLTPLS